MAVTPAGPPRPVARRPPRGRQRKRQRSVRVTVAVSLLSTATVLVLLSLPTRSVLWMGLASVTSLVLAWAALRITWTEVLQSRRENAADRAAAAMAYRELFTARAAEHAELTTAMTERLAEAQIDRRHLEGMLSRHLERAETAERSLAEAQARLASLVAARRDPDVVELAEWDKDSQRAERAQVVPQAAARRA